MQSDSAEEDELAAMKKLEQERVMALVALAVRVARQAIGFGIGQQLPELQDISQVSDNMPVSILDGTNQLITKVLGEHLQLTAEQIHMWAYNSIDLVGDVLQYFKSKSAISLYQGSTRAPLPG